MSPTLRAMYRAWYARRWALLESGPDDICPVLPWWHRARLLRMWGVSL